MMKLLNVLPIVAEHADIAYENFGNIEHLSAFFGDAHLHLTTSRDGKHDAFCVEDTLYVLEGEKGMMFGEFNGLMALIEEYIEYSKSKPEGKHYAD